MCLTAAQACDASSSLVRVATFKGLKYLTGNHLSIPLFKKLLPQLRQSIHDPAERVRGTFLELLLTIKNIRDIKFWDIVSIEHLLSRLEVEKTSNAKRLVQLLVSSYFPIAKSDETKVVRFLHMTRANPKASRMFARFLHQVVSEDDIGKFVVTLLEEIQITMTADPMLDSLAANNNTIEVDDVPALLDVAAVLCCTILPSLQDAQNRPFCKRVNIVLDILRESEMEGPALEAIQRIRSCLPGRPKEIKEALDSLCNMPEDANPEAYIACLHCATAWGKTGQVMDMIQGSLKTALQNSALMPTGKKGRQTKRKPAAEAGLAPPLAIAYLNHLISMQVECEKPLPRAQSARLVATLHQYLDIISANLKSPADRAAIPDSTLNAALQVLLKLHICSGTLEPDVDGVSESFQTVGLLPDFGSYGTCAPAAFACACVCAGVFARVCMCTHVSACLCVCAETDVAADTWFTPRGMCRYWPGPPKTFLCPQTRQVARLLHPRRQHSASAKRAHRIPPMAL